GYFPAIARDRPWRFPTKCSDDARASGSDCARGSRQWYKAMWKIFRSTDSWRAREKRGRRYPARDRWHRPRCPPCDIGNENLGLALRAQDGEFRQLLFCDCSNVRRADQCSVELFFFRSDLSAHFSALGHIAIVQFAHARHLGVAEVKFLPQPFEIIRGTRAAR